MLQTISSLVSASSESTYSNKEVAQQCQANTTSANLVQLEILKLLKELSSSIK